MITNCSPHFNLLFFKSFDLINGINLLFSMLLILCQLTLDFPGDDVYENKMDELFEEVYENHLLETEKSFQAAVTR